MEEHVTHLESAKIIEVIAVTHTIGKGIVGDPVRRAVALFDPATGQKITIVDFIDSMCPCPAMFK